MDVIKTIKSRTLGSRFVFYTRNGYLGAEINGTKLYCLYGGALSRPYPGLSTYFKHYNGAHVLGTYGGVESWYRAHMRLCKEAALYDLSPQLPDIA